MDALDAALGARGRRSRMRAEVTGMGRKRQMRKNPRHRGGPSRIMLDCRNMGSFAMKPGSEPILRATIGPGDDGGKKMLPLARRDPNLPKGLSRRGWDSCRCLTLITRPLVTPAYSDPAYWALNLELSLLLDKSETNEDKRILPEHCVLTSSLNPFQHVNSACRLSSSSRSPRAH